jgi:uncharacterized protein
VNPFTLLIKPAGADCNLRCAYCFYLPKGALYPGRRRHRMSPDVLEAMIAGYLATPQPVYGFCWQGGEPALMGLEFYRQVTELQKRYGRPGSLVANALQTNVTLIDEPLAEHLARYRFLVGCSLDGPATLHDRYRHSAAGGPSHAETMKGIATLRRHGVALNALVLVSQANVGSAREVYRYLKQEGFHHHQYIPCVEFDEHGRPLPFAISPEQWGEFLCTLFDEWSAEDVPVVSVRLFDALVGKLLDGRDRICTLGRDCRQYFVVEHNGDVYPCDFFVEHAWRLGNLRQTTWQQLVAAAEYREFGGLKRRWDPQCRECPQLDLCGGGCLKHRMYAGRPPENRSWLCAGWKTFLAHARPRLSELAWQIRQHHRDPATR